MKFEIQIIFQIASDQLFVPSLLENLSGKEGEKEK